MAIRSGASAIAVAAAALALSACAERPGPTQFTGGPSFLEQTDVVPGAVIVCKYSLSGPDLQFTPGADFTVSATGGTLPEGSSFHLNSVQDLVVTDECATAWQATDGTTQSVTVAEVVPEGVTLYRIVGWTSIGDIVWVDNPNPPSITLEVSGAVGAILFFKNQGTPEEPPPPPPSCNGLTPGYWKNWRNHYTESQFASLLVGTIANGSVATADAIFAAFPNGASDPITKLKWFVLANQLTLNLVGTDLPNPDDADLNLDCTNATGDDLGDALTLALQILANPSGYTKSQILAVKDILDYIANLGDD